MFSKLAFVFSLVLALFTLTLPVIAQENLLGLVVTPAIYELEAERGENYDIAINIQNNSGADKYKIQTVLQGFSASENEGVPTVSELSIDSPYKNWVKFQEESFEILDSEKKVSNIKVSIPQDAQPGSHYLALTYVIDNPTEQNLNSNQEPENKPVVKIQPRIAVMLFLNIKGQVQREASFEYFVADRVLYDPFFDGAKIDYRIKLTGNAYLKPTGNIFLPNTTTSLAINPENKIILPDSARTFSFLINPQYNLPFISAGYFDEGLIQKDTNGNTLNLINTLDRPFVGAHNIEARMLFVDNQNELTQRTAVVQLIYFPWKTLLLLSPVLLLLVGVYFWRDKLFKISK